MSFGSHPVIGSERELHTVTADYPGELCRRLEARGTRPLFVQGPVGALSPLFPEFPMRLDEHLDLVGTLLQRGHEAAEATLEPAPGPLRAELLRLPLPPPRCSILPGSLPFRSLGELATTPLRRRVEGIGRRARRTEPDAPLHLLGGGSWLVIGTPCDLGVGVALDLKRMARAAGIPFPVAASQCDGYVGYVLHRDAYDRVPERGFRALALYENAMSVAGWDLGARFVEAVEAFLDGPPPGR